MDGTKLEIIHYKLDQNNFKMNMYEFKHNLKDK